MEEENRLKSQSTGTNRRQDGGKKGRYLQDGSKNRQDGSNTGRQDGGKNGRQDREEQTELRRKKNGTNNQGRRRTNQVGMNRTNNGRTNTRQTNSNQINTICVSVCCQQQLVCMLLAVVNSILGSYRKPQTTPRLDCKHHLVFISNRLQTSIAILDCN